MGTGTSRGLAHRDVNSTLDRSLSQPGAVAGARTKSQLCNISKNCGGAMYPILLPTAVA